MKTDPVVPSVPLASANSKPSRELAPAASPRDEPSAIEAAVSSFAPAGAANPGPPARWHRRCWGSGHLHGPGRPCHPRELPHPSSSCRPPAAMCPLLRPLMPVWSSCVLGAGESQCPSCELIFDGKKQTKK